MLTLYNTRTRKKETFEPRHGKQVGLYTCGPTVYNFAHIGNLRTYIFEDVLKRTLLADGYSVNHVMNITDVGHLTDDADAGEDKMEKGARREGKTAWEIAAFYTAAFQSDLAALNILPPNIWCKATDNIPEQIALVQILMAKGYTYETSDGIYFDTTKLSDYGELAQVGKQQLKAGVRVDIGEKKHPSDFALWKFSAPGEKRQMEWLAFGHRGFPGWHIECSAMSMKYLGEQFDIHCGGIDHVPVHHANEIAQSEAATGKKPWVNFWLHGEFLNLAAAKMAKSGDNFITLQTLKDKGISPLAYRYFAIQTHYRKQLAFSWEALAAAQIGLNNLYNEAGKYIHYDLSEKELRQLVDSDQMFKYRKEEFMESINDDLNTPEALAVFWNCLKSLDAPATKTALILFADGGLDTPGMLGLNIFENVKKLHTQKSAVTLPAYIQKLINARASARERKNWTESDRLRDEITKLGFIIEDTKDGQTVRES